MSARVETARHQWEEGHRRLQALASDPLRQRLLLSQVNALTEELRRRIGQVFTLRELAAEYERAETWARDVTTDLLPPGRPEDLAVAEDAAFHLYARAARDYEP